MPDSVKVSELPSLIAKAVELSLKQRKLTDAELAGILHGPLTVGLLPAQQISIGGGASLVSAKLIGAESLSQHDPKLIGFVAKDFAALKKEIG